MCPPSVCGNGYVNPAFAAGNLTGGINWSINLTAPAGGAGLFGLVQLVNSTRTKTPTPSGGVLTLSTGGYVLDTKGSSVQYFTASVASGATKGDSDLDEPGTSGLSSS